MELNFNLSEFNISGQPIPEDVADKLLHFHILPLQAVRNKLNLPIKVSKKSGYRSKEWELAHNRPGTSQHCFIDKGAVDLTCEDLDKLEEHLILYSPYMRIARYETFIHCDYAASTRQYFVYNKDEKKWDYVKALPDPII